MSRSSLFVFLLAAMATLAAMESLVHAQHFAVTARIPLGTDVVQIHEDPSNSMVYAVAQSTNQILFIDLDTLAVTNSIYVGQDPSSFDIDVSGSNLYVAHQGPGTGLPGSYRIAVVDLETQAKTADHIVPTHYVNGSLNRAINVTAGRQGRIYYNAGFDLWNGGMTRIMDADTGADVTSMAAIKTMMVLSSDKSRMYGQYVYTGNLGQMGVFDVATDSVTLLDSVGYSPYPYGWDYFNYSLSGDDRYLAYGRVLFNATNLVDQFGLFDELIYALSYDGSFAYGATAIWDPSTFAGSGSATKIQELPFSSAVMKVDESNGALYIFNAIDQNLYVLEQSTTNGIPHRWLLSHNLTTSNSVESLDDDADGYDTLDEWLLDANPTSTTPELAVAEVQDDQFMVTPTSSRRYYTCSGSTNLITGSWVQRCKTNGAAGQHTFYIGSYSDSFYRVGVTID